MPTTFTVDPFMANDHFNPEVVDEKQHEITPTVKRYYFYKFAKDTEYTLIEKSIHVSAIKSSKDDALTIFSINADTFAKWKRRKIIAVIDTKQAKKIEQEQKEQKLDIDRELNLAIADGIVFDANLDEFWEIYNLTAIKNIGEIFAEYFQGKSTERINKFFSKDDGVSLRKLFNKFSVSSIYFAVPELGRDFLIAYWKTMVFFRNKPSGKVEDHIKQLDVCIKELIATQATVLSQETLNEKSDKACEYTSQAVTQIGMDAGSGILSAASKVATGALSVFSLLRGDEPARDKSLPLAHEEKHKRLDKGFPDTWEIVSNEELPPPSHPSIRHPNKNKLTFNEKLTFLTPTKLWWEWSKKWIDFKRELQLVGKAVVAKEPSETAFPKMEAKLNEIDEQQPLALKVRYVTKELNDYHFILVAEIHNPVYKQDFSAFKQDLILMFLKEIKTCHDDAELLYLMKCLKRCMRHVTEYFGLKPKVLATTIDQIMSDLISWDDDELPASIRKEIKDQKGNNVESKDRVIKDQKLLKSFKAGQEIVCAFEAVRTGCSETLFHLLRKGLINPYETYTVSRGYQRQESFIVLLNVAEHGHKKIVADILKSYPPKENENIKFHEALVRIGESALSIIKNGAWLMLGKPDIKGDSTLEYTFQKCFSITENSEEKKVLHKLMQLILRIAVFLDDGHSMVQRALTKDCFERLRKTDDGKKILRKVRYFEAIKAKQTDLEKNWREIKTAYLDEQIGIFIGAERLAGHICSLPGEKDDPARLLAPLEKAAARPDWQKERELIIRVEFAISKLLEMICKSGIDPVLYQKVTPRVSVSATPKSAPALQSPVAIAVAPVVSASVALVRALEPRIG